MSLLNNRPQRLRANKNLRGLVKETRLSIDDLVMPVFFKEGAGSEDINSMPGIKKYGEDDLLREIEDLQKRGIKAILLFGSTNKKDCDGSQSYDENSSFHKIIRRIKENIDILLITDVCLCAYTDHGNCFAVKGSQIDIKKTLTALAKIAVSHAKSGVDMIAPSAMIDGQVKAIRSLLDKDGFDNTPIMSYSTKFASNFYGPFRDIHNSSPSFGSRKHHQMDFANKAEALKEALLDIEEGVDIVMVKPALCYLDIISDIKQKVCVPVASYNVSGEYSMIKAASEKGWLDEKESALEMLTSIKRAGSDILITYWAKEASTWLKTQG